MTEKKKPGPEAIVREIKRNTRRKFSLAERKKYLKEEKELRTEPC